MEWIIFITQVNWNSMWKCPGFGPLTSLYQNNTVFGRDWLKGFHFMRWCEHIMNKIWNHLINHLISYFHTKSLDVDMSTCLLLLSPNESPVFLLLHNKLFQITLITPTVHQKVSLRSSCKHILLSPTFFSLMCLLSAQSLQFYVG